MIFEFHPTKVLKVKQLFQAIIQWENYTLANTSLYKKFFLIKSNVRIINVNHEY